MPYPEILGETEQGPSGCRPENTTARDGAEQYAGDLECVFYGHHLDRAILKIAEAAYCLMPSQTTADDFLDGKAAVAETGAFGWVLVLR